MSDHRIIQVSVTAVRLLPPLRSVVVGDVFGGGVAVFDLLIIPVLSGSPSNTICREFWNPSRFSPLRVSFRRSIMLYIASALLPVAKYFVTINHSSRSFGTRASDSGADSHPDPAVLGGCRRGLCKDGPWCKRCREEAVAETDLPQQSQAASTTGFAKKSFCHTRGSRFWYIEP